jgi:hypothetical protein
MISITFVEQPESASTRHHHTVNHARAAAALPSVIGEPGSRFTVQLAKVSAGCRLNTLAATETA